MGQYHTVLYCLPPRSTLWPGTGTAYPAPCLPGAAPAGLGGRDAGRKPDAKGWLGSVRARRAKTVDEPGKDGDPRATAFDIAGDPLENLHVPTGAVKQIAGDQPHKRAPYDEHPT